MVWSDFLSSVRNFVEDAVEGARGVAQEFENLKEGVRQETAILHKGLKEEAYDFSPGLGKALDNVENAYTAYKNVEEKLRPRLRDKPLESLVEGELVRGAHIKVDRGLYTHHGLYKGNYEVIHYDDWHIHICSMDHFLGDATIADVVNSVCIYSVDRVMQRAMSRHGEAKYNVVFNNCEHFVHWCRSGTEEEYLNY